MAGFPNAFTNKINKKLSKEELIQVIRMNISGELEAIYIYDEHIRATDDNFVKKVLSSIRDEERIHVAELFELLKYLDSSEETFIDHGIKEVRELKEKK